ncbi:hypothetical protein H8E88_35840 [candidate division KSB1 bacterium]|nr:hypothetical protein [candidate division KSB1 bacterium]
MKKIEFVKIMFILKNAGLKAEIEITEPLQNIWFMYFKDCKSTDFQKAAILYISENKFFPTVSDLLGYIKTENSELPDPAELKMYLATETNFHPVIERLVDIFGCNNAGSKKHHYLLGNDFSFRDFKEAYKYELEKIKKINMENDILKIVNDRKLLE